MKSAWDAALLTLSIISKSLLGNLQQLNQAARMDLHAILQRPRASRVGFFRGVKSTQRPHKLTVVREGSPQGLEWG